MLYLFYLELLTYNELLDEQDNLKNILQNVIDEQDKTELLDKLNAIENEIWKRINRVTLLLQLQHKI